MESGNVSKLQNCIYIDTKNSLVRIPNCFDPQQRVTDPCKKFQWRESDEAQDDDKSVNFCDVLVGDF